MTVLLFVGKVILCSAMLLAYYYFFLRNRKYHLFNRFYLLFTILLSLIIPLVKIPVSYSSARMQPVFYKTLQVITVAGGEDEVATTIAQQSSIHNFLTVEIAGCLLYALVCIVLLYSLVNAIAYVIALSRKYDYVLKNGIRFYNTNEKNAPFSFFKSIYWNNNIDADTDEGAQMLRHEIYHVKERHSADIIFMEIICSLLWINPFFHLIKKELRAIHEFLADEYAIAENDPNEYMEIIVINAIANNRKTVGHYFFQSHLKRRINMITKFSGKHYSYASRIITLPFIMLLIAAITIKATSISSVQSISANTLTVVIDAGHGGVDAGVNGSSSIKEKDINLAISKKIKELAPQYNVNVVLTRENDDLPGNSGNVAQGLMKRVAISKEVNADVFISIHMDAEGKTFTKSGFSIYVSRDSSQSSKSKALANYMVASLKNDVNINEQLKQREFKGIYVLDKAICPAILIQCGYLTNEADRNFISQPQNQETVAKAILNGIVQFGNKKAE